MSFVKIQLDKDLVFSGAARDPRYARQSAIVLSRHVYRAVLKDVFLRGRIPKQPYRDAITQPLEISRPIVLQGCLDGNDRGRRGLCWANRNSFDRNKRPVNGVFISYDCEGDLIGE